MELKQLEAGKVFELAGYEWLVLEQNRDMDSTLVVAKDCIRDMAFDEGQSNDFRNSTIRKYLNNDFLGELLEEGLRESDILLTDFDLTDSDGNNIYGYCRDKIGLLSQERYEDHRDILKLEDWWWLSTPSATNSRFVRYVNSTGTLNHSVASTGNNGVRPALHLKSETIVSVDDVIESNGLEIYSSEELLEELLIREKRGMTCSEDTEDGENY